MNNYYRLFMSADRTMHLQDIREEFNPTDFLLEVTGSWKSLIPKRLRAGHSNMRGIVGGMHLFEYADVVVPVNVGSGDFIRPDYINISKSLSIILLNNGYETDKVLRRGYLKSTNGDKLINPTFLGNNIATRNYCGDDSSRRLAHSKIPGWHIYSSNSRYVYLRPQLTGRLSINVNNSSRPYGDGVVSISLVQRLHKKTWEGTDHILLQVDGDVIDIKLNDNDGVEHLFECIDEEECIWEWVGFPINEHKELVIKVGEHGISKVELLDD